MPVFSFHFQELLFFEAVMIDPISIALFLHAISRIFVESTKIQKLWVRGLNICKRYLLVNLKAEIHRQNRECPCTKSHWWPARRRQKAARSWGILLKKVY